MKTDHGYGGLIRNIKFSLLLLATVVTAACGDLYDHKDFTTNVMSKSESDVTAKMGKPKSIDLSDPSHVKWVYTGITFDPENQNNTDAKTIVVFTRSASGSSTVTDVQFER